MIKGLKSFLAIGLVLFFIIFLAAEARAEAPAPTLIAPDQTVATAKLKPPITGLSKSGSLVKIYIDGVYNGKTQILNHPSGTANFVYLPFLNLSRGSHQVYAVAEDSDGKLSLQSSILNFKIELPLPAPTILKSVVNKNSSNSRPFIVGLAKNDLKIKVYIDKKYQGEFTVKNHPSGTANFAYRPVVALARGNHLIYTVAVDQRGKESSWSNIVNFASKNSAIAQAAQEKQTEAIGKLDEFKSAPEIESGAPEISKSSGELEEQVDASAQPTALEKLNSKKQEISEEIKNFIATSTQAKTKIAKGMINESRDNQSKLKLSVVLFILFFVAVIAWLLWVNRELIKERQAQDQAKKDKDNQDKLL